MNLQIYWLPNPGYLNKENLHSDRQSPNRTKALQTFRKHFQKAFMHKRAELNGILVSLETLTPGKQQQWLSSQPAPKTKEEVQEQKRLKRLIRLSKDEESE